jgi:hypothetical protein
VAAERLDRAKQMSECADRRQALLTSP